MTRLLIVDDEHHIVNYLITLFEEQRDLDLDLYKAYSGMEALHLLEKTKIDLLLLDIHMPELNGIEVAQTVAVTWPKCYIIFLTAYDNFEYIYQSNKIKNSSYLLKMETDEVILEEVHKKLQCIEEEEANSLILHNAERQNLLVSHLLQQGILKELLAGTDIAALYHEIRSANSGFLLDLNAPIYLTYMHLYAKMPGSRQRMTSAIISFIQIITSQVAGLFTFSILELDPQSMLLFFQPTQQIVHSIAPALNSLKSMADSLTTLGSHLFHQNIAFVIYPESIGWNQVNRINNLLHCYMTQLISDATNGTSFVKLYQDSKEDHTFSTPNKEKNVSEQLYHELSYYLSQNMNVEYYTVLYSLRDYCIPFKSMHHIGAIRSYSSIALLLLKNIDQYQLMEQLSTTISIYRLYHIHDFSSWNSAFDYLEKLSSHLFRLLQTHKSGKTDFLITKIKEFIQNNLSENLNLITISEVVNYNETYISRVFKSSTGMGISDYIRQTRIAKAQTLLQNTNDSIQKIATATGFDTSQYFSIVFKKAVGISPSEYRLR